MEHLGWLSQLDEEGTLPSACAERLRERLARLQSEVDDTNSRLWSFVRFANHFAKSTASPTIWKPQRLILILKQSAAVLQLQDCCVFVTMSFQLFQHYDEIIIIVKTSTQRQILF
jgi:hypothetical protein